jgi:hypothetical protein
MVFSVSGHSQERALSQLAKTDAEKKGLKRNNVVQPVFPQPVKRSYPPAMSILPAAPKEIKAWLGNESSARLAKIILNHDKPTMPGDRTVWI